MLADFSRRAGRKKEEIEIGGEKDGCIKKDEKKEISNTLLTFSSFSLHISWRNVRTHVRMFDLEREETENAKIDISDLVEQLNT